jgi:hypothetical protein
VADKPPGEIQTLIDNHINGFNTQNNELFLSVFGDTAIIIDGIAPYRWLNPNAPASGLLTLTSGARPSTSHTRTCRTKWGSGTWRALMRTLS